MCYHRQANQTLIYFALQKENTMSVSFKMIKPNKKAKRLIIVCVAILLIIAAATIIGKAVSSDKPNFFSSGGEYVEGIDVSRYNGDIEWDKVAQEVDFAIIRVGYRGYGNGDIGEDANYAVNLKNANKEKLPVGVYFYTQATTPEEAAEEARFLLERIEPYEITLPVFIDYEYPLDSDKKRTGRLADADLSGKEAAEVINAFCREVKNEGYYAGVYASSSVLNFEIKTSNLDDDIYIWVADYNDIVTYLGSYDLWQHTKSGSCNGVNSKYVDRNYWYIGK